MHNTHSRELNSLTTPYTLLLGMQTPIHAATSMLCIRNMITNAWCINATCTSATHSAVHCTTLYAGTIQQCSNS